MTFFDGGNFMDRAEFLQRQLERQKQRQKKLKLTLVFALLILLFITLIFVFAKNSNKGTTGSKNVFLNEYVYPLPPETIPDLLVAINKPDGVKTCYLTFDDGPTNSVTARVLDILRRYDVKATFFTVGTLLEANPDTARRIYDEGHLLANHSYAHSYSKLYADDSSFMNEIDTTHELIKNITGNEDYPCIFRFPGGGFNSGYYGEKKQHYKMLLKEKNIRYCDWNALNGDAEGGAPSAEQLIARVKSSSKNKEDIVILMHDAAAKSTTADSLAQAIEYLISQGYSFKTLDKAPRF